MLMEVIPAGKKMKELSEMAEDRMALAEVLYIEPGGEPCRSRSCDPQLKSYVMLSLDKRRVAEGDRQRTKDAHRTFGQQHSESTPKICFQVSPQTFEFWHNQYFPLGVRWTIFRK
jgi:hypothetical protein